MAEFLSGPKSYTLPLWRGQDTAFTVKRKNPDTNAYINFDAGTTAKIVFTSGTTDYEFSATISGSEAHFFIDDDDVVAVKNNSLWRIQFTVNGQDRTPIVGKVVRKDAK